MRGGTRRYPEVLRTARAYILTEAMVIKPDPPRNVAAKVCCGRGHYRHAYSLPVSTPSGARGRRWGCVLDTEKGHSRTCVASTTGNYSRRAVCSAACHVSTTTPTLAPRISAVAYDCDTGAPTKPHSCARSVETFRIFSTPFEIHSVSTRTKWRRFEILGARSSVAVRLQSPPSSASGAGRR